MITKEKALARLNDPLTRLCERIDEALDDYGGSPVEIRVDDSESSAVDSVVRLYEQGGWKVKTKFRSKDEFRVGEVKTTYLRFE